LSSGVALASFRRTLCFFRQDDSILAPMATMIAPPDGGYGWVCVASQFILNGFTWGIVAVSTSYSFAIPEINDRLRLGLQCLLVILPVA